MYAVWIRIDETLPWIEVKGEYSTRREAAKAAMAVLASAKMKIVHLPEERRTVRALATVRTSH